MWSYSLKRTEADGIPPDAEFARLLRKTLINLPMDKRPSSNTRGTRQKAPLFSAYRLTVSGYWVFSRPKEKQKICPQMTQPAGPSRWENKDKGKKENCGRSHNGGGVANFGGKENSQTLWCSRKGTPPTLYGSERGGARMKAVSARSHRQSLLIRQSGAAQGPKGGEIYDE